MLILAFLLEVFSRNKRFAYLKSAISFALFIAAISAVLTAMTGWVMPKNGEFDEGLLNLHFWSGMALTLGMSVLYLLSRSHYPSSKSNFAVKLYFPFFVFNMLLLTLTGHFGGSLTHGSNYLFEERENPKVIIEGNIEDIQLFEQVIQPIFQKKCTSCHNPEKLKGELLLTTQEGILKGGKTGALIVAKDAENSLMIQRIELPKIEKEHMPPRGKVQVFKEELQLLKWWIAAGGSFEGKVDEMNPSKEVLTILEKYKAVKPRLPTADLTPVAESQLNAIRAQGILLNPQDEQGILFEASLAYDTTINRQKLKALQKIAPHIVKLNLSFSNLDDDLASRIAAFSHLQKLELQETAITSTALQSIKNLVHLESLNLYATAINDETLLHLNALPALQNLYLWQTNTSIEAVQNLQSQKPNLHIHHRISPDLFSDAQLKAPIFLTTQDLFKDSLVVEMQRNFKGVQIYYTLNGTTPNSTSMVYQNAFTIHQSRQIKAIAQKENWLTSEVSERVYTQTKYEVAEVKLGKPPNEKYKAKGGESLVDFMKGSLQFSDGNWLGYEGEHLVASLDLGESKPVSGVSVGALEDVGSYIFFPKGIEVSVSNDGKSFEEVASLSIPTAKEAHPPELKQFLLSFEEVETRYIQVKVVSNLKNPEWHPAPEAKCWVFVDEVVVN